MSVLTQRDIENLPLEVSRIKSHNVPLRAELERQTRFQEVIHEYHWNERAKIINALADPACPSLNSAARRMAQCAQGASFYIDPATEKVRTWLSRCGHRLCPFCSNARSATATQNLTELMLKHNATRLLILTLRSHDFPLDLQVAQLLHCFKRLRNRASWKRYVTGGVYIIEITMNEKTGLWHPHIHILVRGKYYPHAELSKQWREVTGDSNVVWAQRVQDIEGAARELAKYIGKPQRVATLTIAQIQEYASALKSVRMIQTFGDLHGKKPQDSDKTAEAPRADVRVRLSTLLHIARSGHNEAVVLLTWLARRFQIFGRYIHHEAPQMVPDPGGNDRIAATLALLRGEPTPGTKKKPDELTDDQLDHKICQAFTCYVAQLELGTYKNITWYHKTGTEQIDGDWAKH